MKRWVTRMLSTVQPVPFFVVTAGVFGLLFLLITPPFQGADEIVHYERAYQVSELHFVASKQGTLVGGNLPASIDKIIRDTNPNGIAFYPNIKYREPETKAALMEKNQLGVQKFYDFSSSANYSPFAYIGSSTGIVISRMLKLPTMVSLYAGRLGSLIVWIVALAFAIRMIPSRKWALVAIGLLPMALFQAVTINGDGVTLSSLILLFSLILAYRQKKVLSYKDFTTLLVVAIVMVLSKEVMFLFLPLFFLLKTNHFGQGRRSLLLKSALFIIPMVFFVAWLHANHGLSAAHASTNHQDASGQMHFITHNPFSYINVLWNTYFYTWGDGITRSFIGVFGWADTPLSELLVTGGYLGFITLLVATTGAKDEAAWLPKKERRVLWALMFLYWLAVSTSLYVYYSPVGFKIIYGLQGRYFIPLAILALPLCINKRIKVDKQLYRNIAVYMPLILLTASTITIYVRYFIHNV